MNWSKFTNKYIKQFKSIKYNLDQNNILLLLIKQERDNINNFITKYNNIDIDITMLKQIPLYEFNKNIKKWASSRWVYNDLLNNIDDLNKNYVISWKSISDNTQHNIMNIKTTKSVLKAFMNRVKILILIFEYLKFKSNNFRKININLVLSHLEKKMPEQNSIIDVPHVNSGFTDINEDYIFIWRLEEFEKVLIHEMIHFLDMEHRNYFNYNESVENIHDNLNYSEAVTDFFAIIYHIIYINIITNISIKLLFEIELAFIKNQAQQINTHFKLKTWKQYPNKQINQLTPAWSYYIVKYLLFQYCLNNKIINDNYYDLVIKAINIQFNNEQYIKLDSSRMTLLQLNNK
jgi:hypothetical protein